MIKTSFAASPRAQYWSKKNVLKPSEVTLSTNKKFFFNCDKCEHDFETSLANITNGSWCPFCSNQKRCTESSCLSCFQKSFASSDKSQFWSSKNILSPRDVAVCSGKKFIFDCNKCWHEFETSVASITSKGNWCPFCANLKRCREASCSQCFQKSFASSDKSQFWSAKNISTPREVALNCNKKYCFDCNKCGHEFESCLNDITGRGNWCPFCSNLKRCTESDCISCFQRSFASSDKSQFWSAKNILSPREVAISSSDKTFFFDCNKCGHEFETPLSRVTQGGWCPFCVNKQLCPNSDCAICFQKSFACS